VSAITGIYRRNDTPADAHAIGRMTNRLAHRGPDGAGTWHDGPIGLGHCLLWTTPESLREHMPLISNDGHHVITADARIDNRAELITRLNLTTPPELIADSELILHAYERWGASCPEHLLGDFAFAVWDADKQHLFCARDHMGVRPFYYYCSDDVFVFASEIKALFCLPEVPRELNEKQVAYYLAEIYDDRVMTFYKDIRRLPAAHVITIAKNDARTQRHWSLDPTREIHFETDEEYEQAFRDIFTEAVRCRLRSAFPVGAELSGGLDSSSVVCVARDLLRKKDPGVQAPVPLHTFSVAYDEVPTIPEGMEDLYLNAAFDERPYFNAVLAEGDLEPHIIFGDQLRPLAVAKRMLWHAEQPIPPDTTSWEEYRTAQSAGVRILLGGLYGDNVVSYGLPYITDLMLAFKWRSMITEIATFVKRFHYPLRRLLRGFVVEPIFSAAVSAVPKRVRALRLKLRAPPDSLLRDGFIRRDLAERTGLLQPAPDRNRQRRPPNFRQRHYADLTSAQHQDILETYAKETAGFSLERRFPFLDRRLIEFCLALPGEQKFRDGWTRAIERHALSGHVPAAILWRITKGTYQPQMEHALQRYERALIEDLLFADPQLIEPYIDVPALRDAYPALVRGVNGGLLRALRVALLALWLRETGFLSREGPSQHQ
jgi:asparagine synthase (glutamine-hydrolysing)